MRSDPQQKTNPQPKFMELADFIIREIESEKLKINDRLPSVNALTKHLNISKETALKGLNYLSEQGIVRAVYRKGYYVEKTDIRIGIRVLFMLDKMTTFKDELYQAFYDSLSDYGEIDVFFHHHNFTLFRQLIEGNLHNYTHFVIVTYLKGDVRGVLNRIPTHKLLLLDAMEHGIRGNFASVYQDFDQDIYRNLQQADKLLDKYQHFFLVAPPNLYHLTEARKGFIRYCREKGLTHQEIDGVDDSVFNRKSAFLTLAAYDIDEVKIIKLCRERGWKLGEDIGLISYNDTPVKEVLEGGITVITTDFARMGQRAAEMIICGESRQEVNEAHLIIRNSL